jgi:hypothetical protein
MGIAATQSLKTQSRIAARATLILTLVACAALLVVPAVAGADASSLYQGASPRPGPDILYEPPADAPQLQNSGDFQAPPILVSGTSAYRDGEFLYQDYLYDDTGALGQPAQNDPRFQGNGFSRPAGTYTYPTNTVYGNNAADFVELRVKPLADATAFRITLNTLKSGGEDLVATTIGIGNSALPVPWPHGANVSAPAQLFLTVHGSTAELINAVTGLPVGATPPTATVDLTRRQITVTVPHSSWDPTGQVVRLAAGVGLWNSATSTYRVPTQNPSTTQGGGAGLLPAPPAFYNVAFRFECQQQIPLPPGSLPAGCESLPDVQSPNAASDPSWWREHEQAHALMSGDISQFHADVDFNKLTAAVDDDMPGQPGGVPQTGPMNRILASHFEPEQGAVFPGTSTSCTFATNTSANGCGGWYRGQLQPYDVYVPEQPMPSSGYGLTLLLHSLDANYNQFLGTFNQSEFGERGAGSIVISPEARGPDGWYYGRALEDTFEVWADVAAHYKLDPEWTAIAGYSMGGYGTYKLATQFPDLFAKAQPTVGPPALGQWDPPAPPEPGGAQSNTNSMLGSLRNIPILIWNAAQDELVPVVGPRQQAQTIDGLGYRYEFDLFDPAEHLTLAINDEYGPATAFLGTTKVNRDPSHVTYVYNPTMNYSTGDIVADHAYWLSGVTLRNAGGTNPLGTIDVRSHGFGVGDPTPSATVNGAGTLTGGASPAIPYTSQAKTWGATPTTAVENKLDISQTNVSSITVNATRAHVNCGAQLNFTSSPPHPTVNLVDCPPPPSLSIADQGQAEGDGGTANESFTVTRAGDTVVPVSVHYETVDGSADSSSDYDAVSGDLAFAAGETTKTINVPIHGDTTYENDETFTVHLSAATTGTIDVANATGTITNDDPKPTLSIADKSQAEGDAGTTNESFTVTRSGSTAVPISVHYQTTGGSASSASDYDATSGDLTFDPSDTTKTIDVPIHGDATYENDETFTVHLSTPVDATIAGADATGTITNDDPKPTLSISDQSVNEGNSGTTNLSFTVTLAGDSALQAAVHYQTSDVSASSASDYDSTSGDLTFDPGQTTKTIDVPIHGDTTYEEDETFTVHLSAPAGATIAIADATGTITNDDLLRPVGASPIRVSLVPAFQGCDGGSANSSHGAPLDFGSCNPAVPASTTARLGAKTIGFAELLVCGTTSSVTQCSAPGVTRPDMRLFANLRDVRCAASTPSGCSAGADYNPNGASGPYSTACASAQSCNDGSTLALPYCAVGQSSASDCLAGTDLTEVFQFGGSGAGEGLRITDTYNGQNGDQPATVTDTGFPVPIDCLPTPSNATIGSTCAVNTSANALVPGVVRSGDSATWQLGEVEVLDSGPDGTRGNSDDEPLAVQGIYLP